MVEKFRKILTHRAATESTDLYTIYWDEASQHVEASLLYTYAAAESAMRKARRKQLPPVPESIQDVGEVLTNSNLFRVHSGQNKDKFYQTMLDLNGSTCLIFAHMKTMEQLGKVDEMYLDASIKMLPNFSTEYHLLTVHSVQALDVRKLNITISNYCSYNKSSIEHSIDLRYNDIEEPIRFRSSFCLHSRIFRNVCIAKYNHVEFRC